MKFKFLYEMYKSCTSEINIDRVDTLGILNRVYENSYHFIYKFKQENEHLNTHILDVITDEFILGKKIVTSDKFKAFKNIAKVMRNVSIDELKVLRKFRLTLERDILKLKEVSDDEVVDMVLYSLYITICLICEGFILYRPIHVRNTTRNIGNDLDTLYDIGSRKDKHPLVAYKLSALGENLATEFSGMSDGRRVITTNKAISTIINKEKVEIFVYHYLYLVDLLFNMTNKDIVDLMGNYIDEDTFKLSPIVSTDNVKEFPTLVQRYVMEKDIGSIMKNRTVIIPSGGIYVKYPDGYSLACEYEDNILGRSIFWYTRADERAYNGCKTIYLKAELNTIYILGGGDSTLFEILGLKEYFEPYEDFRGICATYSGQGTFEIRGKTSALYSMPYEIYAPKHWGETKATTHNKGEHKKLVEKALYGQEIKVLSPFKRTLPVGQSRSAEAEELAAELCIKLKPNETIVRQFERHQRVRLK